MKACCLPSASANCESRCAVHDERLVEVVLEPHLGGARLDLLVHRDGLRARDALRVHEDLGRVHIAVRRQSRHELVAAVADLDLLLVRERVQRLREERVAHVAERAHHIAPHVDGERLGHEHSPPRLQTPTASSLVVSTTSRCGLATGSTGFGSEEASGFGASWVLVSASISVSSTGAVTRCRSR
jgi:hypothetical protein